MKKIVTFVILIFGINSILGQNIEQVAVDFFAHKIDLKKENLVVKFDGKISRYYGQKPQDLINDFYRCKSIETKNSDKAAINDTSLTFQTQEKTRNAVFRNDLPDKLKIPEGFKYSEKLKYKNKSGGFMIEFLDKIWYSIFPNKINFSIETPVFLKPSNYVRMFAGNKMMIVKINDNLQVTDWCEESWLE